MDNLAVVLDYVEAAEIKAMFDEMLPAEPPRKRRAVLRKLAEVACALM